MTTRDQTARLERMRAMRERGLNNVEIGEAEGLSRERVRQLLGNLPPREWPSLVGRRFGDLVVVSETDEVKASDRQVVCRCDCGREGVVREASSLINSINSGSRSSCMRNDCCAQSKLTSEKVRAMRIVCASGGWGEVNRQAKKLRIHPTMASKILHGELWPDAGGPIRPPGPARGPRKQ